MCEYCGCRSIAAIDELTREHDLAREHIHAARQAIASTDRSAAVRQARLLLDVLGPHIAVEEDALFPAMAAEHPAHIDLLHREHDLVHAALEGVALDEAGGGDWPVRLTGALDVLREHILKEQDGLFPAALSSLDISDWERVEQVRARVGSVLVPPVGM